MRVGKIEFVELELTFDACVLAVRSHILQEEWASLELLIRFFRAFLAAMPRHRSYHASHRDIVKAVPESIVVNTPLEPQQAGAELQFCAQVKPVIYPFEVKLLKEMRCQVDLVDLIVRFDRLRHSD